MFFKRYWNWFKEKTKSPHAAWWLALYSFCHSIFLPVPTDFLLVPIALAHRARAAWFVIVSSVAATLGAAAGYAAAALAYALIEPIIATLGIADQVALIASSIDRYTFAATLVTALTPLPDLPLIIAAGLLGMNPIAFFLAYFAGRVLRLGGVTLLALLGVSVIPSANRDVP